MKKKWKYLITAGVGVVIAVVVLACKGTFTHKAVLLILQDLCDAFFIPGAIFICFGGIVWASNGGAFDMLKYGGIKFIDRFRKNVINKKYHTFYDYREAQKGKEKSSLYFLLIGLAFVVVAVAFYIAFRIELNKVSD